MYRRLSPPDYDGSLPNGINQINHLSESLQSIPISQAMLQRIRLANAGLTGRISPRLHSVSATTDHSLPSLFSEDSITSEVSRRYIAQSIEIERQHNHRHHLIQGLIGGGIACSNEDRLRREMEEHMLRRDAAVDSMVYPLHESNLENIQTEINTNLYRLPEYGLQELHQQNSGINSDSTVPHASRNMDTSESSFPELYDRHKKRKYATNSYLNSIRSPKRYRTQNGKVKVSNVDHVMSARFHQGLTSVGRHGQDDSSYSNSPAKKEYQKFLNPSGDPSDRKELLSIKRKDKNTTQKCGVKGVKPNTLQDVKQNLIRQRYIPSASPASSCKSGDVNFPSYSKKWKHLKAMISRKHPNLSSRQLHNVVRDMFMDSLHSGNVLILDAGLGWSKGYEISGIREGSKDKICSLEP